MQSAGCYRQILIKFQFYRKIFEKSSNTKFHENPRSGSRAILCGQTDGRTGRHDEASSRFSQLRERCLNKGKKRHVQNNMALYDLPDTFHVSMTNSETVN